MHDIACHQLLHCLLTCFSLSSMHPFMQLAVRGGIRVTGNFSYHIEPECCIKLNITCEQEDEEPTELEQGGEEPAELEQGGEEPAELEQGDEEPAELEQGGEGSDDLKRGDKEPSDLERCDLYASISSNGTCTKIWVGVTYRTAVYGSWQDSYVDLYAYYQTRRFKSKWPVSLYKCVYI